MGGFMVRSCKKLCEAAQYHTNIKEWPEGERPREKMLSRGIHSLTDAELLAIIIRTGTKKATAVDIAKTMLTDYGSLSGLGIRSVQELRQYHGLGDTKAISIIAAFETGRRTMSTIKRKAAMTSPVDVFQYYHARMMDLTVEVFTVLLLDSANHLQRDVRVSEGILNSSLVHPREVFRPAIIEPSAAVILIHNHPSGNPEPSAEDITVTRQIVEAGKIIGIPVHDHVILTRDNYTSFAEKGLL
jgi:DNA repair protein RadC